jgi:hypothetical protein
MPRKTVAKTLSFSQSQAKNPDGTMLRTTISKMPMTMERINERGKGRGDVVFCTGKIITKKVTVIFEMTVT